LPKCWGKTPIFYVVYARKLSQEFNSQLQKPKDKKEAKYKVSKNNGRVQELNILF
jgi:hypothetical protein